MNKRLLTLLAALVSLGASAQTMQVEYFIDTDPGLGKATTVSVPMDAEGNAVLRHVIPASQLPTGTHLIGVRALTVKDQVTYYGPTLLERFFLFNDEARKPLRLMEYFWDADPGFGKGTQVALPADFEASIDKLKISTTDLEPGTHTLGVRVNGGLGWGPTVTEEVTVLSVEDYGKILKMEYFWDVDPGYGKATPLAIEPGTEVTLDGVVIPMPNDGQEHKLGLRGYGNSKWGPTFIYDTSTPAKYVNSDDLAALLQLYNQTGGENWTGKKWTTTMTEIRADNWSGVSFNSDDRVSAIDLKARGLSGRLSEALPAISAMTTLNLSQNALSGDPAVFVSNNKQLTSLDLSYNQFDELSQPLSLNLSDKTLVLTYQHRVYNKKSEFPGLSSLISSQLNIGRHMDVELPSIAFYNHATQSLNGHPKLNVYSPDGNTLWGSLAWQESAGAYTFANTSSIKVFEPDDGSSVIIQPATGSTLANSAYPGTLHFILGDANMNGWVDVNDVQRTLNYILNVSSSGSIGLWPANTYSEGETTTVVNIQDIVCTVNIVLENEDANAAGARRFKSMTRGADRNLFYTDGRNVMLDATDDIAAFDLELEGVGADEIRLMLNARDWQMVKRPTAKGVRLMVFSPTGARLEQGAAIHLLKLGGDGTPVAVEASSPMADDVPAGVQKGTSTSIHEVPTTELMVTTLAGSICLNATHGCGKTLVSFFNTKGVLLGQHQLPELRAGQNVISQGLPAADGLIIMTVKNDEIGTRIFKLQIAK